MRGQTPKKINMNSEILLSRWNNSGNNDAIKSDLLDSIISDTSLKLECIKRR